MKKLFFIPLIIFLFACGGEKTSEIKTENITTEDSKKINADLSSFTGNYIHAEKDEETNEVILVENCWSKSVETFELSEFAGSPGHYYFAFHGHHSIMYIVEDVKQIDNNTLEFKGTLEDESSDKLFKYSLTKNDDGSLSLKGDGSDYTLIEEHNKKKFRLIPCDKRRELSDLDYMNEIFMAFFALKEGGETLSAFIPEEGIELIIPGPGVAPTESTVQTSNEITATNLFNTPAYNRLMEYVQMHNNEERAFLEFTDELPDRCMPEKEALLVKSVSIEDYKQPLKAIAMLTKMNDELGEAYTYVIIHIEFTDRMRITKIDARDCGA